MKIILTILLLFVWGFGQLFAQQGTVRGVIVDKNGETLPGVNVIIQGTTLGVVTDIEGNFILLRVSVGDIL